MTLRRPATTLTDSDLRSHLRALSDRRPTPGFGPTFPDRIRDGAHRRRTNSRIATAFALVLILVGIPLALLATLGGGTKAAEPAAATVSATPSTAPSTQPSATPSTAPAAASSYGGVTATWLPPGMTHTVDNAVVPDTSPQQGPLGPIRLYRRDVATPALTIQDVRVVPGMFLSQFTDARTPALAGPDQLWITVSWAPPDSKGLATLTDAVKHPQPTDLFFGKITTTARTVNGRPAILATVDDPHLTNWISGRGAYNHDALLAWATPSGTLLTLETATVAPTDLAALQKVADGIVLGTRPPNPTAPPAPDPATMTAVLGALHDAFGAGVTTDRFTAAVQGGAALTAPHTGLLAENPQLGPQVEPPYDAEAGRVELIDPNTVTAVYNLEYGDPTTIASLPGTPPQTDRSHYYGNAIISRTPTGWQVSRGTFCDAINSIGIQPGCPLA